MIYDNLVKILSKEENINAGATRLRQFMGSHVTFESNHNREITEKLLNPIKVREWSNNSCSGLFLGDYAKLRDCFPDLKAAGFDITVTKHNNYQDIRCHPIPRYAITYEDKLFECENCGKQVNWKDLRSDYGFDWHCDDICPLCECSTGIEYILERLEDS